MTGTLAIGPDVGVRLRDPSGAALFADGGPARAFVGAGPATLRLTVRRGPRPPIGALEPLLAPAGSPWQIYRRGSAHVFALWARPSRPPYEVAVIDFSAGRGRLHVAEDAYPFEFPLSEIVFSRLLADHDGLIVHACGVCDRGCGTLLAGHSGAGKSTLAALFARRRDAEVLSDDRVAARLGRIGAWMSGTPWCGTAGVARPRSAPLGRLVFLRHARRNRARRLTAEQGAARLLALSVIPYWDPGATARAISTGATLARRLPAYEVGFVPGERAVDYLHALDHAE